MPTSCCVHPEFGYLCLPPRLRRWLRISLLFILFGTIIVVASLRPGQDHSTDRVSTLSGSDMAAVAAWPEGAEAEDSRSKVADIKTVRIRFEVKPDAAKGGAGKSENYGMVGAIKTACEDDTWAYLDGRCAAAVKPRWVRVRAVSDNPAIAAVAIGRTTVAPVSVDAPPSSTTEEPPPAKAATATVSSTVAAKKPQKSARSQNRHLRETREREDYWGSYASYYSDNRRGASWVWSRGW